MMGWEWCGKVQVNSQHTITLKNDTLERFTFKPVNCHNFVTVTFSIQAKGEKLPKD